MPKGLAFLSKKSWHTSKLCNQEKVWIAEQQQQAEEIKIKELAKQIQKEREEEELNRISGKKSNRLDRGIDWMYQGGPRSDGKPSAYEEEQRKKEQEDYLLGKEFNPDNAKKGDLAVAESTVGVNMVLTRASENRVDDVQVAKEKIHQNDEQDWNSNFHLRHEDPMFFVEQQRKAQIEHQEKKQRLFEKVNDDEGHYEKADEGRHGDRENYRRRGRDREEDRGRITYSSESEERKHRRKEKKKRHRSSRKRRERSRSHSSELRYERKYRKGDDLERKKSRRDKNKQRHRARHRHCSRSRSRSADGSYRGKSHDQDLQTKENIAMSHGTTSSQNGKSYGLIGSTVPICTSDLGPDKMLLAKKIQEREEAKNRCTNGGGSMKRKNNNGYDNRKMTREEREKALEDMQAGASARIKHISKSQLVSNSDLYEDEIKRRRERGAASTNFLNDIARQSHGIDQDMSLASRVSQHRNKSQRNHDDHFL